MIDADWLQPTRSKAAIAAVGLTVQCLLLLLEPSADGFSAERPVVAVLVGLAAGLPVALTAWSPTVALALSSVVTLATPLLAENGSSVIYAFIVTLLVYAWGDATRPVLSFVAGFTVLAMNEMVGELLEEAAEDGVSWREVDDTSFILPALLESVVIALLVVGLGTALVVARRQAAMMVGLERANGAMALEAERHRIARDLHDVAAHHLSSIVVRTSTARKLGDPGSIEEAVAFAGDTADEALTAMRQIVTLLRSDQGVQTGLADLDHLVETAAAGGVEVVVEVDPSVDERLGMAAELAMTRVVQEALANVIQHSEADRAIVSLTVETDPAAGDDGGSSGSDRGTGTPGQRARLLVTDPGPATPGRTAGTGLGLIGMRERIEPLGGTVDAGPGHGGGWTVDITLPLGPGLAGGQRSEVDS